MCSSKAKVTTAINITTTTTIGAQIGGRPVLQPTCNRIHHLEARNSLQKKGPPPPPPPPPISNITTCRTKHSTPVPSPPLRSPRPQAIKRGNDVNGLNTSSEKVTTPRTNLTTTTTKISTLERKKSKKTNAGIAAAGACDEVPAASTVPSLSRSYSSSSIIDAPGSIAAVRREQMALLQAQRKMKIAHYGRSKSAKFEAKVVPCTTADDSSSTTTIINGAQQKRCSFITPNSDPIYVAYHDEEWGVPVHEDNMLFELLVLSGAQVGSDWTSILKKRQEFRNAFSGFDPESVAKFNEKKILSVSSNYGIELSKVRGIVDNSNRILEVMKEFGSFERYIWGFVNHKPISTNYGSCQKIPVKTSKSESISKDMVRRGFRFVGPTIVHSFMQASGLTNDHLINCHRHFLSTD
ncbi:uncharacterized protein LOC132307994 [Cornus florida]|uniref:uncharacterized protein LOC132307994 n=1 Tax=Cornus florida TaxID=4283 RepID=UPI0028A15D60|nr:uncharacterized protein LOC132307994 [Cornus florida]